MANGRGGSRKKGSSGRDGGRFVALPITVLDSDAYKHLGASARALLVDIARQFTGENNGRLVATMNYLRKRGWTSPQTVSNAKRELIHNGFLHETVRGGRPNRASWYAITWQALGNHPDFDAGTSRSFIRSAYRDDMATFINKSSNTKTEAVNVSIDTKTEAEG